nr:hypothetical protein BaRGS_000494 [Batillaria attramentaria]
MMSNPALFDYNNPYSQYHCINIPNTDLATFFKNPQTCLLSHNTSVLIITFGIVIISVFTFLTLFYRYRWHIRLVMYAFRANPLAGWRQRRPEDFQYDLFVSYDSEDSRWVHEHLMPALEEGMGLRLCLHQRDFIPGKNITNNIVDSLDASKRVLAVFSPNFAESQWCQFELEMCLTHVVEGDDVMVIVMLEEVPARDMSGAMRALMKTTTYIEWDNDPEAVASFWRRMALALGDMNQ